MQYGYAYITNEGLRILADVGVEKNKLSLFRFTIGDGILEDESIDYIKTMKRVKHYITSFAISSNVRSKENEITLRGTLPDAMIHNSTYIREIGLSVLDPVTTEELMFAYIYYGTEAEYVNKENPSNKERLYEVKIALDNAENVTIITDNTIIYPTREEMNEAIQNVLPKCVDIFISSYDWIKRTEKYEYTVTNPHIHANDKIDVNFDETSLDALESNICEKQGSLQDGSFVLVTREKPNVDLTGKMYIQGVRE